MYNKHKAFLCLLLLMLAPSSFAHKLAPSLLRLSEVSQSEFQVYWKTPVATAAGQTLRPVFPPGCQMMDKPETVVEGTARLWTWLINCKQPLAGERIAVEGMAETATASLVKIQWLDGRAVQQLLTAGNTSFVIPQQQSTLQVAWEYVLLGVEHIWLGIDHLLFVLALVLLVNNTRRLIWTITSFTIGHSITLSLVVLGYLNFPVSLVELAIAASIFVLAVELVKQQQTGQQASRWIAGHSWLVAVLFGLLHGMGFAGALKEVGLPLGDIPLALLSFNIGIELGQVAFVLVVVAVMLLGRRYCSVISQKTWWVSVYAIGGLSAFWCIERGLGALPSLTL